MEGQRLRFSEEAQSLGRCAFLQHRGDVTEEALYTDGNHVQFELAGLDFGKIETGIDDAEQVFCDWKS
jgi:hypothetical protein